MILKDRIIRIVGESNLYDVEYVTLWEYIKRRFKKNWYVKNVEIANSEGMTYEPLLYKDKCIYDEKGIVTGCYNQQLPRETSIHTIHYH